MSLGFRRTLFTLPNFSAFSPSTRLEPERYHERKILPYNRKQLYDVVADVDSYPQFVPFCTSSRILTPGFDKYHKEKTVIDAELTVGFLSLQESYVSTVTCSPYESVEVRVSISPIYILTLCIKAVSSSSALFRTLSTSWRFYPEPPSPKNESVDYDRDGLLTLVTLDLVYAFSNPLHASVSSSFFSQVSKLMVQAFEKRCSEVYRSGSGDV
ncbi:hypothetical protein K443DRAFT_129679 [Laccaria amethystina LaAM-08-1]|uniref:Coenzyme Q-binding protein COQ10 START domain-containing protein n=1 Tax=Laccaria amethystina LaAM-08-1 TaxID=1095629 RepID=A0A0C9XNG8_9AGAR|nr:hypothetical protein K443DRAFT_129679 [Laccaria amethystina LaAM-08-1]